LAEASCRGYGEDGIYFDHRGDCRDSALHKTCAGRWRGVGVPVEEIARLAGHASSRTTEVIYRRELRPVITTGAEVMDQIFRSKQRRKVPQLLPYEEPQQTG